MVAALAVAVLALDLRVSAAPSACPGEADVATALAARLPAGGRAAAGWSLSLAVAVGDPRALRLDLRDAAGRARLERTLPLGDSSCRLAADAVALVVERYFTELGPAEAAAVVAAPAPAPASPVARRAPRLEVIAGAGLARGHALGGRATIELRVAPPGPLEIALGTALPAGTTSEAFGGGTAELSSWPLRLGVGGGVAATPRLALGLAADAQVSFERAETHAIPRVASGRRVALGLGGAATAMLRVAPRWRVGLELCAHRGFGPAFLVTGADGASHPVLAVPSWDVLGSLRVGFAIVP